jgi:hypothetical protein
MNFLRKHHCLLPYRDYRCAPGQRTLDDAPRVVEAHPRKL